MSKAEEIEANLENAKEHHPTSKIQQFLDFYVQARAAPFKYLDKNPKAAKLIIAAICFII